MACRRGTHDAILANEKLLDAIGCADLRNLLNHFGIIVAAIACDDEEGALGTLGDREEDASDEGFGVIGLLEDLDSLPQAGTRRR